MTQWRNFSPGNQLPATWTDGMEQLLSTYASANFTVVKASATTVKVPAGTINDQAGIMIQASPRWITADAVATHPGGAAGTYDVYVTCTVDTFGTSVGPPPQETDTTTRTFGLKIGAPSGTGAEALSRKVAQVVWDGATITSVLPVIDLVGMAPGIVPIGAQAGYAGSGDPPPDAAGGTWLLADGRLVLKATFPEFFNRVQHTYNLGVDPGGGQVKIPDKRGRVQVGQDNMGTAAGAAGRLPSTSNQRGQTHGEERHTLSSGEMPVHNHVPATGSGSYFTDAGTHYGFATGSGSEIAFAGMNTAGGGGAHNVMQLGQVDNVIVRVA